MTDRITVTRTFTAPREVLWNVVTGREQFATWFGTEAVDVPLDTLDWSLVEGERWSAVMHLPDGTTKPWIGDFVEVVPPSHFAIRLTDPGHHRPRRGWRRHRTHPDSRNPRLA